MQTSRAPWIEALHRSRDALRVSAGPLGLSQLAYLSSVHKYPEEGAGRGFPGF
jgi:hypothetical protein